jgi:hypothetical protein
VVYGRAVTVDGVSIMTGMGVALLSPSWRIDIARMRERFEKTLGALTRDRLLPLDDVLRRYYLTAADEIFNPRLPKLRNTDGDPFEQSTLHYALRCTPEEALPALRSLNHHTGEDVVQEQRGPGGELASFSLDWTKRGNRLHRSWDNTLLGHIDVDGDTHTATVNSARRATRLRKQIDRRLGDVASLLRIVTEPMDALLAKRRSPAGDDLGSDDAELSDIAASFIAQHWDDWLDAPVPALGNVSPREAAKTPEGRASLEALLDDFEWHARRSQAAPVHRLRKALELPARSD